MTDNPILICIINLSIVFGVLIALAFIIKLIHVIDPTKKKVEPVPATPVAAVQQETAAVAEPAGSSMEDKTLVAVITAAIMAYGYSDVKVTSVKKV